MDPVAKKEEEDSDDGCMASSSSSSSSDDGEEFCERCGGWNVVRDGFCQPCLDDKEQEDEDIKHEVYFARQGREGDVFSPSDDDEQ